MKEKLKRAGKGSVSSAVLYRKNILTVLREKMLSTASDSFFLDPKMFQLGRRILL